MAQASFISVFLNALNEEHHDTAILNSILVKSILKIQERVKSNQTEKRKAHPPESPLNGGIIRTIPLRGGVLNRSGEGAFYHSSSRLRFSKP